MNDINLIINGKIVKGKKEETVLSVAKRYGFGIPTLCHDDRLEPYSSCYVCVVEIEGYRGLQPACSTKIAEGMKIETNNGRIFKARKTALELLLSNHYADCIGPCKQTCPAGVDVQGYIAHISEKRYHDAVALIKETNPLPAICGRVCVRPCEVACRRNLLDEGYGVGIDYLKRFASDFDLESANKYKPEIKPDSGKKVAVIGAGPGGLSAAFFLRKEGHAVDIFESSPHPGGWLRYGIPEYRLPNDILQKEVDNITELGVNIYYNQTLGDNLSYKALKFKYNAIVLAIGSQKGTSIGCEGDDAENVLSGIDFLKTMELTGKRFDFTGKTVAIIGGGNTAMDCCRSSVRCGAKKVYIIYRRSEQEMPANPIEIHESKLEGVEYMLLTAPVRVNKDKNGKIVSLTCNRMELGEADASGRRRPITIEGSEFDLPLDYAIAAIGQRTVVKFIEQVNQNTDIGELKLNKWGDIETDPLTLQTGIRRIFACGDGVTGPATLIQAIGQARVAAVSCDQFLRDLPVIPLKKEFLSKKENFRLQIKEDYAGKFLAQMREEMPTLPPENRDNFSEVELGYRDENVALNETNRCLECGCSAVFTCDLKKHSTEYDAEQTHYGGLFKEHEVDFRHPYIEIDNNKCILCSRCIRICREVVGANALGLVNRGFETYVSPSLGNSLSDTHCESCGMCISACPTGAISENYHHKPGPFKLESIKTICNYCSVGCEININHTNGFIAEVTGSKGKINSRGNICRYPKFGYNYLNSKSRITKPLLKTGGKFEEITFNEAINIVHYKIKSSLGDDNAFFAGARLSNEELYLIQKLARFGAKTNNICSFHYLNRGEGFINDADNNAGFDHINGANKIYLLGSEISRDNAVVGFIVNNNRYLKNMTVELITSLSNSSEEHKADKTYHVSSYYYFIKALNHYLVSNNLEDSMYVKENCADFDSYKENLIKEDYRALVSASGIEKEIIEKFASDYIQDINSIIIFSEKEVSPNAATELLNLAMISGKMGKTCNGIIALKEKNNSQGLIEMGIFPWLGPGKMDITDNNYIEKLKTYWKAQTLPQNFNKDQLSLLRKEKIKNLFIFGEDPVGCASGSMKIKEIFRNIDFIMVQDYFMSETAGMADLIIPASFPVESGGTYVNSQKVYQKFESKMIPKVEMTNCQQLSKLLQLFGSDELVDVEDVMMEAFSLMPSEKHKSDFVFRYTKKDQHVEKFNHGCDYIIKMFDSEFERSF